MVGPSSRKAASAERRRANRARGEGAAYPRVRARPILKGTRSKITRRCLERRLFLAGGENPEEIRNFYGYTLGLALERYDTLFHGGVQMGNHHHVDTTDQHGNRPAFKDSLHANLARGLNAKRGRFDKFWSAGASCDTCQPSDEETLEDLAYSEANPVVAGLVKWARRWPGFTSHGWKFGETRTFRRPDWYYDPANPDNPPEVHITRVRPPIFPELTDDELYDRLMKRVREIELEAQAELRAKGRRFKGEKKLAKDHWDSKPTSWEDRFTIVPKVAASCRMKRAAQLQRNRKWEREYAIARAALQEGRPAIFPEGTYWLRLHCGVRVAQGPP
jgi:putative transposase